MKKNRQKTGDRARSLRAHDLSAVRGGDNGVIHGFAIVGGALPDDNGVISSHN